MIPFRKMNGLGNDFVVVDARRHGFDLSHARIAQLAARDRGIGFDQFIVVAPATGGATARMRIFNADGGEVEACGNAARCVAALLLDETAAPVVSIESDGGAMAARRGDGGMISVDMGAARFDAADIPVVSGYGDPQALVLEDFVDVYGPAACVSVGNPHAVFFVADCHHVPLSRDGPRLESHPAFPARANISFAEIRDRSHITARVWERGVGATMACGTAACAIGVLSARLGLTEPAVDVALPGGTLRVDVTTGRIVMEGPYALDYVGAITADGFVRDPLAAV